MNPLFASKQYVIRRKLLKLVGASFHVYDMNGGLLGFSSQAAFKLKEDIQVFTGEDKTQPLLQISARNVIDFSAAYDIVDATTGQKVGVARRKGMTSLLRDSWEILDASDQPIGKLQEDSMLMATLRRFLSNWIPQTFHLDVAGQQVEFRQHFNPFIYKLEVNIPPNGPVDTRLIFGVAVLLAAIEGRQG
ncbi:MAG: hypothetical protein GY762_12320 [Proteobacteria bacterium]|nr:hypothetical protein [Pseudomonadota bacterium]